MISFKKLYSAFGLLALIWFLPTHQNVLPPDSLTIQEPATTTSPAKLFIELSTSTEGLDEREEDLIDGVIIRVGFSKNMGKALQKFKKLTNPAKYIKRIVSEVFQEDPQNAEKIIQFINLLSDIETKYFAIWTLHEEMLLADKFDAAYDASTVLHVIQNTTNFKSFSEFDQRNVKVLLKSLEKMEGKENAQKRKLLKIRQEKFKKAQKIKTSNELQNSTIELEERKEDQDLKLFELQSNLQSLTLDVDSNFKKIFKVAQNIRELEKTLNDENKEFFEALKDQIPKTIYYLTWQEPVCIRMANNGYYMYSEKSDGQVFGANDNDVRIFVLTNGKKPITGYQWQFEVDDNGENFHLKNYNFENYLYRSETDYLGRSYNPYNNCCPKILFRNKKIKLLSDKWAIQLKRSGTSMYLQNVAFSEYLSSDALFANGEKQAVYLYREADQFTIEKC